MKNSTPPMTRFKNGAIGWFFISLYMFAPMVLTVDYPKPPQASGSPITSDEKAKEQLALAQSGLGGPENIEELTVPKRPNEEPFEEEEIFVIDSPNLSDPALNRPLELHISGGQEPKVYRINYFKTVDAQLPVDPTSEISSDFGWRTPPCNGCSADHRGVDFIPGAGEPVYAIMDGMVVESGFLGGYGYWVKIEHLVKNPENEKMERWESVYAHLQEGSIPEEVAIGAVVNKGQIIGKVGSTGMSTGPHLHFEIRIEGEQIDPMPLISSYQVVEVERDEDGKTKYQIYYQ